MPGYCGRLDAIAKNIFHIGNKTLEVELLNFKAFYYILVENG